MKTPDEMNAEKRYLLSEARLRALTEATSDALYRMSPDWAEMKELDGGGFISNTLSDAPDRDWLLAYIPPEDQAEVTRSIDAAIATKQTFSLEHRVIRTDGSVGWTLSRAVPILDEDGQISEWFGAASDVTARKDAELQLRLSKERLEVEVTKRTAERDRIWNLSPDLMMIVDREGLVRDVNPSWTQLLGYSSDEVVGHRMEEFVLPEAEGEAPDPDHPDVYEDRGAIRDRFRHKDGSTRWIYWTSAPTGEMTYAIGRDDTRERKQALDLREAQDALRQSQKMEAVGQLTGGVAHDFNNLLTVIRGSVDMLRRETLPPDKRSRFLDAIGETADRAAKLTSQLLAFARRQALKPVVFDVRDCIVSISDMLDSVTGNLIQIERSLPAEPCLVRADISQFETALVNMAVNARDAMGGQGSLTITVERGVPMPAIRGHASANGRFISVAISDTGSGITPEALPKIFEPFFTTKDIGKGTGLGLSQVYGFSKQSGGDVEQIADELSEISAMLRIGDEHEAAPRHLHRKHRRPCFQTLNFSTHG